MPATAKTLRTMKNEFYLYLTAHGILWGFACRRFIWKQTKVDMIMFALLKAGFRKVAFLIPALVLISVLTFICLAPVKVQATETNDPEVTAGAESDQQGVSGTIGNLHFEFDPVDGTTNSWSTTLRIILVLTVISLAPSILIMMTSFTRIIIVLHFLRTALGTQTTPPNQVMIGLALFLTIFIMSPTINDINTTAVQPLANNEITAQEAFELGQKPVRTFMIRQIGNSDSELRLFLDLAGIDKIDSADDVPMTSLIPAFVLSEMKKAFIMGFLIYLPFLVIDMVVSSTLMSMGMMMLPPTTISMPFKILLFIIADGWNLIIGEVVKTFYYY